VNPSARRWPDSSAPTAALTSLLPAAAQLDQDFWKAALTCKEGDWLREPVKTQWGWHLIMVQGRKTLKKK